MEGKTEMAPEAIEKAKAYIKRNEGCRLKAYRCSNGHYTVGWGHKLQNGENFTSIEYTQEMVDEIFEGDFKYAIYDYYQVLKIYAFSGIGEWRQIALMDMCFQMGLRGVLRFKKTLSAMEHYSFNLAATEVLDSKYAKNDSPNRAKRTAYIFEANKYPSETLW